MKSVTTVTNDVVWWMVLLSQQWYSKRNFLYYDIEFIDAWVEAVDNLKEYEKSSVRRAACSVMAKWRNSVISSVHSLQFEKFSCEDKDVFPIFKLWKTSLRENVAVRGDTRLESNIYQFDRDRAINGKGQLFTRNISLLHTIFWKNKCRLISKAPKNLLDRIPGMCVRMVSCEKAIK